MTRCSTRWRAWACSDHAQPLSLLVNMLHGSTSGQHHAFWPDDISMLDTSRFHHPHIHALRRITDLYLLGLAVRHGGRLVALDLRIALSAVTGAQQAHLVLL